jgi:hypothetical protein
MSGRSGFSLTCFQAACSVAGSATRLGSYVGQLTDARIAPFRGSIATIAPRRLPSASTAARCTLASMPSATEPGGACSRRYRARHCDTGSAGSCPMSESPYAASTPDAPNWNDA